MHTEKKIRDSHFTIYSFRQDGSSLFYYRDAFLAWFMALVVCMSANLFRELYLEMTLIMSSYKERCRAHHKIHAYTHTNLSFSVSFGTLPSSENNYPVDGDATGYEKRWKMSEWGFCWQTVFTASEGCFCPETRGTLGTTIRPGSWVVWQSCQMEQSDFRPQAQNSLRVAWWAQL